ncbi:Alpha/Beta hydrolase protein [Astrocystis sublimbata]|nr:Alpha/Beta hydrolase protein [Astrocystis sublimbata]
MQSTALCWWSLIAVAQATTYQFPELTGPHLVGRTTTEVIDYSRIDPLAPTSQPRALVVSFFYPTTSEAIESGDYEIAPAYDAVSAAVLDEYLNLTRPTAKDLITRSYGDAPLASDEFPVLLFTHGFAASRNLYQYQLEDLASHGWIIANIDITYDAYAVEFPDGSIVQGLSEDSDDYPGQTTGLVELRARDVIFVRSALENTTVLEQIPALSPSNGDKEGSRRLPKLKLDRVGSFGHSLGGATSALTLLYSPHFVCGANFDGPIYGEVLRKPLLKPFIQIARTGNNQTSDASWGALWRNLEGFKRQFEVRGTVHRSFQDFPIMRDLFGDRFPEGQGDVYGTVSGEELTHLETALMDAYFGWCLKGRPSCGVDNVLPGFPELFPNL